MTEQSQISEKNLQRIKEVFEFYDENQDGTICMTELEKALHLCGYDLTPAEVEAYMAEYDKDSSKTMDLNEFVGFFERVGAEQESPEEQVEVMKAALADLDTDGNGYLDRNELKAIMTTDDDAEIDEMFNELDKNGDGKINCCELAEFLTQLYQ